MVTIPGGPSLGSSNGILVVPRGLFREKGRARSHRWPRHTSSVGQRERLWRRSSRVEVENDSFNSCIAGATCTARVDARQSVANGQPRNYHHDDPPWYAVACYLLNSFCAGYVERMVEQRFDRLDKMDRVRQGGV